MKPAKLPNQSLSKPPGGRFGRPLAGCFIVAALTAAAQSVPSDATYSVIERGMDYRIWSKTVTLTDPLSGIVTPQTTTYCELGNGISY